MLTISTTQQEMRSIVTGTCQLTIAIRRRQQQQQQQSQRRAINIDSIPPLPPTLVSRNGYDRWNDRNGERLRVSGPSQEWRRSSLIPECQQKLRNIRLKYFSMRRLLTCRPLHTHTHTRWVHYWPCARRCVVVLYSHREWKLATGPPRVDSISFKRWCTA